jgi:hypothetical protein
VSAVGRHVLCAQRSRDRVKRPPGGEQRPGVIR